MREEEDTTKKKPTMKVKGKRRSGRHKKSWLDNVREDINEYNMTEEMT